MIRPPWLLCSLLLAACAPHSTPSPATPASADPSAAAAPADRSSEDADDRCLAIHFGGDFAAALPPCTRACDANRKDSCYVLGGMYARGEGVPVDATRAHALESRACQLGSAQACIASGASPELLVHAREQDCKSSEPSISRDACAFAGEAYLDGKGVPVDRTRARRLLERACKLGSMAACNDFDFQPKR